MRIGELARKTGTTPKAVRLYEARGLLGTVARAGTYRQYGEDDVARVQLIRHAQALGFRLADLDGLPPVDTTAGWERMAQLIAQRRAAVAQDIVRLAALDAQLALLEAELHTCNTQAAAPAHGACVAPSGRAGAPATRQPFSSRTATAPASAVGTLQHPSPHR